MRKIYYCFDPATGFKVSRLRLTDEEAAFRSDITALEPPDESSELRAVFSGGAWALVERFPAETTP